MSNNGLENSHAEKALPGVQIQFGDPLQTHTYLVTLGSMCKLEKATGLNPFDSEVWRNTTPSMMAALVWCGLLHAKPNLTIEEVANQILPKDYMAISEAVRDAFMQASSPEEKKTDEAPASATS